MKKILSKIIWQPISVPIILFFLWLGGIIYPNYNLPYIIVAGIFLSLSLFIYFFYLIRKYLSRVSLSFTNLLRFDNINDLSDKAMNEFVNTFGFDYAVFSPIDFLRYNISSEYYAKSETINLKEASPEKWMKESNYKLAKTDILSIVVQKKKNVIIINNKVVNDENIDAQKVLNDDIKERHKNIARILMPLTYTSTSNENDDIVVGVVELGFKNKLLTFPLSSTRILRYIEIFAEYYGILKISSMLIPNLNEVLNLKPYLSLFAQRYYRIYVQNLEQKGLEYIFDKEGRNLEDQNIPKIYLQKALERLREWSGATYGIIAQNTFNNKNISFIDQTIFTEGITEKDVTDTFKFGSYPKEGKTSITKHVLETDKPYFSGNVHSEDEKYYLKALNQKDVNSEICIPLRKDQTPSGVLLLSSIYFDCFNQIHAQLLERFTKRLMTEYARKKRYFVYESLSMPSQLWQKPEDIYKEVSGLLKGYFDAQYIAIWKKNSLTEKTFVLCNDSTPQDVLSMYGFEDLTLIESKLSYKNDDHLIKVIECNPSKDTRFCRLIVNNNFKSYLSIGVIIQGKYEAFINILSKRALPDKISEREVDFLKQVSNKLSISLQALKLVSSFNDVAQSLSTLDSEMVKRIGESALRVTNSDIVSFFPYNGKEILLEDAVVSGGFSIGEERGKPLGGKANLANLIIEIGSQWFSNPDEYYLFLKKNNVIVKEEHKKIGFRFRNSINSTAAVCVEHQGYKKGVIFFNYRNTVSFEERTNLKALIENFSTFLGLQLANRELLQEIKDALQNTLIEKEKLKSEVDYLSVKRHNTLIELNTKQKELYEIETQFAEILPRATRTSFYQILEGINHNIKHSLFEVFLSLKNINSARLTPNEKQMVEKNVKIINKTIDTVETMLDLFDFTKQDKERLDVNNIISQVIKFFEINEYKFIKFEKNFSVKPLVVVVNKAELTMIFYNIINNAIHALIDKHKELNENFEGVISISTQLKANQFILKFSDNGTGIDSVTKAQIFDRGFTTKKNKPNTQKGTGIGLYFVKQIIENEYEGKIDVQTKIGNGSDFIITIPEYINFR